MEPVKTSTDLQEPSSEEDYGLGEVWQSIESFNREVELFFEALIRMLLLMGSGFVLLIGLSYVLFTWIGSPRSQSKAAKKKFWLINGCVMIGFLIIAVLVYVIPAAIIFS
ncbi:hypothetical protein SFC66_04435 [Terribacillus saccharophilus]|uniref:hypothetical protein n=1 Tax=Terribacillus saccharophilus TaxID=361277 RepID=UPI00398208E1